MILAISFLIWIGAIRFGMCTVIGTHCRPGSPDGCRLQGLARMDIGSWRSHTWDTFGELVFEDFWELLLVVKVNAFQCEEVSAMLCPGGVYHVHVFANSLFIVSFSWAPCK